MTSDRPYRKSVSPHEALTEMRRCARHPVRSQGLEVSDMALRKHGGASGATTAAG
jgi:hypothetical protein